MTSISLIRAMVRRRAEWLFAVFCALSVCAWMASPANALGQMTPATGSATGGQSVGVPTNETPAQSTSQPGMPNTPSMLYPGEDFKLSPGDLISVRLFLEPEYAATVRVEIDGTVKLPFIGHVPVQGLSVADAQTLIADRLRTGQFYTNPHVIITVAETVNGSVMITGEVRAQIPVANQRSLREVLLSAGGLPANASHTIKIVRPGVAEPIVVELGTDLAASAAANIPVHPHDIIQVTRASVVYVLGAFSRQGSVPLDQSTPLTLLQLAALSGGINFEGKYNDLRLIRTVGTERKVVQVDIKKIRDGKANDPILQANDIVFLPTDSMKAVLKNLGIGGVLGMVSLIYALKNY